MKRYLACLCLTALIVNELPALTSAAPRIRADDGGLWHFEDNPASMSGGMGRLIMGLSYDAMDDSGAALARGKNGTIKAAGLFPLLGYYGLAFKDDAMDLVMGSGLSFGKAFSLGFDYSFSSDDSSGQSYGMGLLLRPASFLSLGLTGDVSASGSYGAGMGIALRPLALAGDAGPNSRSVNVNADMSWTASSGFEFDSVGLRLFLSDFADLRAWYAPRSWAFDNGDIGLELSLYLGPGGITAMTPSASASSPGWRVANDIDLSLADVSKRPSTLPSSSAGRRVLVVKDVDAISLLPDQGTNRFAFLSTKRGMTFPALIALLEEARFDRGVVAVAFENLPPLGAPASYQEFADELRLLRKAGKKVHFYGESFGREYALIAAEADDICLNPLGSLALAGFAYRSLYFKPLFDKLGVKFVNLAPWDTKSAYNSFTNSAMPSGEEAMMRRFYGDLQDQLGASLAAGRGAKLAGGVAAALDGGPYLIASEALKAGLVDSVVYAGEFEESLRKDHPGAALVSGFGSARSESWGEPAFKPKVAVVWLTGTIGTGKGQAGGSIGSEAALEIERLRKDKSIAGILLRVDSGGGSALTSDIIARELRLAVEAGKPVAVSMGRYAASGGYYISAPASWIVAEPGTITGSIGVTGLVGNFSEALGKLGVKYDGFDLSPGSSFLDPFKALDGGEISRVDAMILAFYDRFVGVVAAGRKMSVDAVKKIGEGNIYTGREARKLGLVDELGGLDAAKAWLEGKLGASLAYVDVLPGEAPSLLSSLSGLSSAIKAAAGAQEGGSLESLLGPFAARLQSLLDMGSGPLYYLDTEGLAF
jgi:protease IV